MADEAAGRSRSDSFFIRLNQALRGRSDAYLARRPHRSFRRTLRRDYARSLTLPGYGRLTLDTARVIVRYWRLFGLFFVLYTLGTVVIIGVASQANYSDVSDTLKQSTPNAFLRTATLFGASVTGNLNPTQTANTSVLSGLLLLLGWLTVVWLLRHVLAGTRVRLRDGLYSAGAPLVPTALVAMAGLFQALPLIAVSIISSTALSTSFLAGGVETMLFVTVGLLLAILSLYWLTSTFFALVIVTLPGMYPWAALRAAGDLVVGRRLRLLLRLLWLAFVLLITAAIVLIPAILAADAVSVAWLPIVPVVSLALGAFSLLFASTYVYLLYRKLVEDEAGPA